MTAERRSFRSRLYAWASSCLVFVTCLVLSSCIYTPRSIADPEVLELLDQQLLATRDNDAEAIVSASLYYDYQTKEYRKGTQEDVEQTKNFLANNPELWNFQSYTITEIRGGDFLVRRGYRIDIKLQYKDGRTRPFQFYFRHLDGKWWITDVITNGLLADN